MLSWACSGSTSVRLASIEEGSFFFQPLQFHLQAANVFVEFGFMGVLLGTWAPLGEEFRCSVEQLAFPVCNLAGVDRESGRERGGGFEAFEGFEGDFGFELGRALFTLWHVTDPFCVRQRYGLKSVLFPGPVSGVHYTSCLSPPPHLCVPVTDNVLQLRPHRR